MAACLNYRRSDWLTRHVKKGEQSDYDFRFILAEQEARTYVRDGDVWIGIYWREASEKKLNAMDLICRELTVKRV